LEPHAAVEVDTTLSDDAGVVFVEPRALCMRMQAEEKARALASFRAESGRRL
jgi:hypothetical protein